jgi:ribosomal protein S18 acetylase RimI-like enzyme
MDSNIEIKIVDSWNQDEIVKLYKSGGWWKESYDPSEINRLIKGSFAFAIAFDSNIKKAVGMGRILSDGVSDAYIQDIVVLKNYREKGIGKEIIKTLIKYCKKKKVNWIGLIAEPNQQDFYERLGFKKMKNYTPMKYKHEE